MTIAAANVAPDFSWHQKIEAKDLPRVDNLCVVFEHEWTDDDGERCYAYTVGGTLDGQPLGGIRGGATVGGDVIIVHANNRAEADFLAGLGVQDTVRAIEDEGRLYIEAHAARARLDSVGAVRRIELATAPERNADFLADAKAVERLRGDDVVLTVGGVDDKPQ